MNHQDARMALQIMTHDPFHRTWHRVHWGRRYARGWVDTDTLPPDLLERVRISA